MKKILLVALFISGCAHKQDVKQSAYIIGQSSKLTIDTIYNTWDRLANDRVTSCVEKLPPEEHTKSEYDECVGPFSEANQKEAVRLLEHAQAAQLVLYVALSENRTEAEVAQARDNVVAAVKNLRAFIEEHR